MRKAAWKIQESSVTWYRVILWTRHWRLAGTWSKGLDYFSFHFSPWQMPIDTKVNTSMEVKLIFERKSIISLWSYQVNM